MMNKYTEKALAPVRGAIRGWAFCNTDMLRGRLAEGERKRDELAEEYRSAAEGLLTPLREALARGEQA